MWRETGWESFETDSDKLVGRDDIDLVDICTSNDTHRQIVMAAASAGQASRPAGYISARCDSALALHELSFPEPACFRVT